MVATFTRFERTSHKLGTPNAAASLAAILPLCDAGLAVAADCPHWWATAPATRSASWTPSLQAESTHAAVTSDVERMRTFTISRTVSSNAHPLTQLVIGLSAEGARASEISSLRSSSSTGASLHDTSTWSPTSALTWGYRVGAGVLVRRIHVGVFVRR